MNVEDFRKYGHQLIDMIADYHSGGVEKYPVGPINIEPGSIFSKLPTEAPIEPESFSQVMSDLQSLIIPNLTHWVSPNWFAFFPANTSFPSILGELASAGLGVQGMLWLTSPACTEVETMVMDWMAKVLQLPNECLSTSGKGGGVILGSASEASLQSIVTARERIISRKLKNNDLNDLSSIESYTKLVVYVTDQTHSSVKKGCRVAGIPLEHLRIIPTTAATCYAMSPELLSEYIEKDKKQGLIPCIVFATVGTTSSLARDPLEEIGKICKKEGIWLHIDAAMAGSACICPEYRHLLNGVELADSLAFNTHKWLLVNFDCTCFWTQDKDILVRALSVNPEFLKNNASATGKVIDYRDWQIPLGRRFRALKLWFVMRTYGVNKLQDFIRSHVSMAEEMERWVKEDHRFELVVPRALSLVCIHFKGTNEENKKLLDNVNATGKVFLSHTVLDGKFAIRVAIGSTHTKLENVRECWNIIVQEANKIIAQREN